MLTKFIELFIPRATTSDVGKKVKVLWNPQGVRDFGEKPSYRSGVIECVSDDGGFDINFGSSFMICPAIKFGQRINPFKNVIFKK